MYVTVDHHCSKPSTVHDSIKAPEVVMSLPIGYLSDYRPETIDQRSIYYVKDRTAPSSTSISISAAIVYVVQLICLAFLLIQPTFYFFLPICVPHALIDLLFLPSRVHYVHVHACSCTCGVHRPPARAASTGNNWALPWRSTFSASVQCRSQLASPKVLGRR
jgi:hypothetical protein